MSSKKKTAAPRAALPEVHFSDHGDNRFLHLESQWVQGAMLLSDPQALSLEYIQRMMAWLLFVPPEKVAKCHAMQMGLGAAALTKFCRKRLRIQTTAIELNPQVIAACRLWFKLPADDTKLSVILGDAAEVAASDHWAGQIDALQVDLYDHEAAAPVLDDADFYANCRNLLTEQGCMTVNLFGRRSSYEKSVGKMAEAFGADAMWAFKPTREGNTVVLAQRTPSRPTRQEMLARADAIALRWGLPAAKWLKVFKPWV